MKTFDIAYDQKLTTTIARLQETRGLRVIVRRINGTPHLQIIGPGVLDTYKTFVLPLVRMNFPEAYTVSKSFTPEPWASDPYMKALISLDPKVPEENTVKTVYQACDGEIFEDRADAVNHEDSMFDSWLDELLDGRNGLTLYTVVRHFNESEHLTCKESNEFYGTPFDMLKAALQLYWKDAQAALVKHSTHPKRSD
jgi:hypothetical protein